MLTVWNKTRPYTKPPHPHLMQHWFTTEAALLRVRHNQSAASRTSPFSNSPIYQFIHPKSSSQSRMSVLVDGGVVDTYAVSDAATPASVVRVGLF